MMAFWVITGTYLTRELSRGGKSLLPHGSWIIRVELKAGTTPASQRGQSLLNGGKCPCNDLAYLSTRSHCI